MAEDFQLPEPGSTLSETDTLRDAVREALVRAQEDANARAEVTIGNWNKDVLARSASSRGISDIQLRELERKLSTAFLLERDAQEKDFELLAGSLLGETDRTIEAVDSSIDSAAAEILDSVRTSAVDSEALSEGILSGVSEALRASDRQASSDEDRTRQAISSAAAGIDRDLSEATRSLSGELQASSAAVLRQVDASTAGLTAGIKSSTSSILGGIDGALDSVLGPLASIPKGLLSAAETLQGGLDLGLGGIADNLLTPMWEALLETVGLGDSDQLRQVNAQVSDTLKAMDPESRVLVDEWEKVQASLDLPDVLKALLGLVITVPAAAHIVMAVLGKRAEQVLQTYALASPWMKLPVPDQIDAWKRDLQGLEVTRENIRKLGYSAGDAQTAIALRRLIAPAGLLVDWWLRGFIQEPRLRKEIEALGYDQEDVQHFVDGAYRPPGIQDIISMAVREVFSPGQRVALDLDQAYPEQLTKLAQEQGLSEEWARNFWAAHWQLPSVTQAFEMLHRDVMTPEQLDGFLQAADYAPVWRPRLTAISYQVVSRVDLRRFWAEGLITDEELETGYRHMGYSPADAGKLAEFTKRERKEQRAKSLSEFGNLSPAQMRDAVHMKLLDRNEAEKALEDRGWSPREADIFLALTKKGTPEDD